MNINKDRTFATGAGCCIFMVIHRVCPAARRAGRSIRRGRFRRSRGKKAGRGKRIRQTHEGSVVWKPNPPHTLPSHTSDLDFVSVRRNWIGDMVNLGSGCVSAVRSVSSREINARTILAAHGADRRVICAIPSSFSGENIHLIAHAKSKNPARYERAGLFVILALAA